MSNGVAKYPQGARSHSQTPVVQCCYVAEDIKADQRNCTNISLKLTSAGARSEIKVYRRVYPTVRTLSKHRRHSASKTYYSMKTVSQCNFGIGYNHWPRFTNSLVSQDLSCWATSRSNDELQNNVFFELERRPWCSVTLVSLFENRLEVFKISKYTCHLKYSRNTVSFVTLRIAREYQKWTVLRWLKKSRGIFIFFKWKFFMHDEHCTYSFKSHIHPVSGWIWSSTTSCHLLHFLIFALTCPSLSLLSYPFTQIS